MQRIFERVRRTPKRVVFAEGEEEQVIRAAYSFVNQGLGTAILVGREDRVRGGRRRVRASTSPTRASRSTTRGSRSATRVYAHFLYERLQRKGYLFRDCQRLINQDRNHFAACMVALGDADAMVTGVTRNFSIALEEVRRVIDDKPGHRVIGVSIVLARGRTGPRRRHRGHRNAERRGSRRHRRSRRPASRGGSATSRASRCSPFRTSAIRRASAPQRVQEAVRILDAAPRRLRI